ASELRTQHAADERTLTLEQLPHLLAARALHAERVPAIGGLPAGGLAALDREVCAAVEGSGANAFELRGAQLAAHPHPEFAPQRVRAPDAHRDAPHRGERRARPAAPQSR